MPKRVIRGLIGMALAAVLGLGAYYGLSALGLDTNTLPIRLSAVAAIAVTTVALTNLLVPKS